MKKFGKFMLFTTAVAAAAGAVYYFKNKNLEKDDYEDFDEEEGKEEADRSYVDLDMEAPVKSEEFFDDEEEDAAETLADEAKLDEAPEAEA